MTMFHYKALGAGGDAGGVNGTVTADTAGEARRLLRERGLVIYEIAAAGGGRSLTWLKLRWPSGWRRRGRHSAKMIDFVRELATLFGVGTTLVDALDTIILQHTSRRTQSTAPDERRGIRSLYERVKRRVGLGTNQPARGFAGVLMKLREDVSEGSALATAMRRQPEVFDHLTIHLVEMGEQSGALEEVLERLADVKEHGQRFRGQLGGALIYPCIVLVMAALITVLLMTFVVPNILEPLTQAGKPLPAITMLVKQLSDLCVAGWWWMLGAAIALVIAAAALLRTERGRWWWDRTQLRLPMIGAMLRKQAVVRIAVIISTMMKSGLPFLTAAQVARDAVGNRVIRQALDDCGEAVRSGSDIAEALEHTRAFPPMVVQVFALGQQSGRLETMLDRLADSYDKQLRSAAQRFAALLEPLMILLLALLVGFIAFATILPILEAGHVL